MVLLTLPLHVEFSFPVQMWHAKRAEGKIPLLQPSPVHVRQVSVSHSLAVALSKLLKQPRWTWPASKWLVAISVLYEGKTKSLPSLTLEKHEKAPAGAGQAALNSGASAVMHSGIPIDDVHWRQNSEAESSFVISVINFSVISSQISPFFVKSMT